MQIIEESEIVVANQWKIREAWLWEVANWWATQLEMNHSAAQVRESVAEFAGRVEWQTLAKKGGYNVRKMEGDVEPCFGR